MNKKNRDYFCVFIFFQSKVFESKLKCDVFSKHSGARLSFIKGRYSTRWFFKLLNCCSVVSGTLKTYQKQFH